MQIPQWTTLTQTPLYLVQDPENPQQQRIVAVEGPVYPLKPKATYGYLKDGVLYQHQQLVQGVPQLLMHQIPQQPHFHHQQQQQQQQSQISLTPMPQQQFQSLMMLHGVDQQHHISSQPRQQRFRSEQPKESLQARIAREYPNFVEQEPPKRRYRRGRKERRVLRMVMPESEEERLEEEEDEDAPEEVERMMRRRKRPSAWVTRSAESPKDATPSSATPPPQPQPGTRRRSRKSVPVKNTSVQFLEDYRDLSDSLTYPSPVDLTTVVLSDFPPLDEDPVRDPEPTEETEERQMESSTSLSQSARAAESPTPPDQTQTPEEPSPSPIPKRRELSIAEKLGIFRRRPLLQDLPSEDSDEEGSQSQPQPQPHTQQQRKKRPCIEETPAENLQKNSEREEEEEEEERQQQLPETEPEEEGALAPQKPVSPTPSPDTLPPTASPSATCSAIRLAPSNTPCPLPTSDPASNPIPAPTTSTATFPLGDFSLPSPSPVNAAMRGIMMLTAAASVLDCLDNREETGRGDKPQTSSTSAEPAMPDEADNDCPAMPGVPPPTPPQTPPSSSSPPADAHSQDATSSEARAENGTAAESSETRVYAAVWMVPMSANRSPGAEETDPADPEDMDGHPISPSASSSSSPPSSPEPSPDVGSDTASPAKTGEQKQLGSQEPSVTEDGVLPEGAALPPPPCLTLGKRASPDSEDPKNGQSTSINKTTLPPPLKKGRSGL